MEFDKIVYAIADNIISGLGATTAENTDKVLAEKTGIGPVDDKSLYPEPFPAQRIDDRKLTTSTAYQQAKAKGMHRLEQLMVASASEALARTPIDVEADDVIFIFSSTKGNIRLLDGAKGKVPNDAFLDQMAKRVSQFFGAKNDPLVISNACISGVLAQVVAMRLLKSGSYTTAIIIGGDELTEFVISGFESFKSVSANPCKPYDAQRDGLSMGEGVATLIVSTNAALAGKHPIMLAGGASSNDANHISGPSRTGDGLYFSMRNAMAEAGANASEIDLIDAHGTATPYNDEMESKAIGLAGLNKAPLVSLKGYFGHTLGASGLLETIICLECMRRGIRPRTLNFEQLGVPVPVNVSTKTEPAQLRTVLKTASGFGGCNAAVVISSEKRGKDYTATTETKATATCRISNQKVQLNGTTVYDGTGDADYGQFIRNAFKAIAQPYMKFPKMDDQCKLALTATEYLLKDHGTDDCGEEDVALLLACNASSLDTDVRHQEVIDIKDPYMPSPAIFVYTLANIMEGEICIRHKMKGENLCLVTGGKKESSGFLTNYANLLLAEGRAKKCLIGYADYLQGKYEAEITLIEKKQ